MESVADTQNIISIYPIYHPIKATYISKPIVMALGEGNILQGKTYFTDIISFMVKSANDSEIKLSFPIVIADSTESNECSYVDEKDDSDIRSMSEEEIIRLAFECFGMWKDRDDIGDDWVEEMRSTSIDRLEHIYGNENISL